MFRTRMFPSATTMRVRPLRPGGRRLFGRAVPVLFLVLAAGCASGRDVARRAPALARGPVLQNVTPHSVTVLGRPVDARLKRLVIVRVTPEKGAPRWGWGRYDPEKDTFEITVKNLPARTRCRYWVIVGGERAGPFEFITAPADARTPVRIAFYGDTRSYPAEHARVADAILAARPDIVLCTGDLVADGRQQRQWDEQYFGPARNLFACVPCYPCLGNHDRHAKRYFDLHALPGNEAYYVVDYGCVRLITLDQFQPLGPDSEQRRWLEKTLAQPRPKGMWTIVQFHVPPFGVSAGRGINLSVVDALVPLLEKHRVDLVVSGHDHHYARTHPLAPKAGGRGIVYIVTGGGGAPLYTPRPRPWAVSVSKTRHFILCEARPEELRVETRTADGRVIDRFRLKRGRMPGAVSHVPFVDTRRIEAAFHRAAGAAARKPVGDAFSLEVANPATRPIRAAVHLDATGSRWRVEATDLAGVVPAGYARTFRFSVAPPVKGIYPTPRVVARLSEMDGVPILESAFRLAFPNRPTAAVTRSATPPVLDGRLEEAAWRGAASLNLLAADGSGPPPNRTTARVLAASDGLYVGFQCPEDEPETLRARANRRDARDVRRDDSVEIWVDPTARGESSLRFVASVTGAQYDARYERERGDAGWNGGWTVRTRRTAEGWTAEIRIPWSDLGLAGPPPPGTKMGFNALRRENEPVPGRPGRFRGVSCQWAVTFAGNAAADRFGTLVIRK